ncbi:MAG: hypothetical protein ACI4NE_04150 [Succinivibrio sp.]
MEGVNVNSNVGTSAVSSVNETQQTSGKSIQYIFAMVQLELAKSNKAKAQNKIEQIRDSQADSKKYTEVINILRELKTERDGKSEKNLNGFPQNSSEWNDLPYRKYSGTEDSFFYSRMKILNEAKVGDSRIVDLAKIDFKSFPSQAEFDTYISQLQSLQESTCGTDTQQLMIECQDFMGQYNTYLSGANSQIQKESDVSAELARAR